VLAFGLGHWHWERTQMHGKAARSIAWVPCGMPLAALLASCAGDADEMRRAPMVHYVTKAVHAGVREKIDAYTALLPDCSSQGYPELKIVGAPAHGTLTSAAGQDFPTYLKDDARSACNSKPGPSTQVFYQSAAGFHGKDAVSIIIRYPSSTTSAVKYLLEIW
jgi:hypothetical protein